MSKNIILLGGSDVAELELKCSVSGFLPFLYATSMKSSYVRKCFQGKKHNFLAG